METSAAVTFLLSWPVSGDDFRFGYGIWFGVWIGRLVFELMGGGHLLRTCFSRVFGVFRCNCCEYSV